MNIIELINKKKNNDSFTKEEIDYIITSFLKGEIKDYQMSSLLMAICFNPLDDEEIVNLTMSYVNSGKVINLDQFKYTIDKHSTGGVGDKTSLIIGPMLAALGFCVAKFSGRGLGHTGGTVDKLEAISGFNCELNSDQFVDILKLNNMVIASQSDDLVIADKKIYALRDVTATVDSIGLIAASIMSKKIAGGSKNIILDVKYGSGAFMNTIDEAEVLAQKMVLIGKSLNRNTIALISSMEQPLGFSIGNANEVLEAVEFLKTGEGSLDLKELCYKICIEVLLLEKKCTNEKEAIDLIDDLFKNKLAYNKFIDFVNAQGGDINSVEDILSPSEIIDIFSEEEGYIEEVNAIKLANLAKNLGAGRITKEDSVDHSCGIDVYVKVGDKVNIGDLISKVYVNKKPIDDNFIKELGDSIKITSMKVEKLNVYEKIIR